MCHGQLELV